MELNLYSRKYKPNWYLLYVVSIILHILIVILLFVAYPKTSLEVRVKEVKINLVPQSKESIVSTSIQTVPAKTEKKQISKKEVDEIVFEVVAPKISKNNVIPSSTLTSPSTPTKEIVTSDREFGSEPKSTKEDKISTIKGYSEESDYSPLSEKELLGSSTPLPSSKGDLGENVSGNIKWVKGSPRKVIEWYSPEIPPNILKKETEVILTFYIEPSGFVSRVEILKTSGEPLIDEIISKTMRRIRFNTANYSTVANVYITIIPK